MGKLFAFFTGSVIGFFWMVVTVIAIVGWWVGAVLAFGQAFWFGVASFIVEPSYSIYGLVHLFGGPNIAHLLYQALVH